MHCITSSIFFSVFEHLGWLALESKIELLEYQVRMLLVIYVCQAAPGLRVDLLEVYTPRRSETINWSQIIEVAKGIPDDGHVLKTIRGLAEEVRSHFPLEPQLWIKAAHMVLGFNEYHLSPPDKWMRGPGWEEAWDVVLNKK